MWFFLLILILSAGSTFAQRKSWLDGLEPIVAGNLDRLSLLQTINVGSTAKAMAWSSDGDLLALGVNVGILLFQIENLTEKPKLLEIPNEEIASIALSPDGAMLASGSIDGTVQLWDIKTGGSRDSLQPKLEGIDSVDFNADGSILASGGSEGLILWDTRGLSRLVAISSGDWIAPVRFSPNGDTIAFYDFGSILIGSVSDLLQGRVHWLQTSANLIVPSGWSIKDMSFSPDGELVAAACANGQILLWRTKEIAGRTEIPLGNEFRQFEIGTPENSGLPMSISFSRDSSLLATSADLTSSQELLIWTIETEQKWTFIESNNSHIEAAQFNPLGTLLVSIQNDGTLSFWGVPKQGDSQ